MAARRNPHRIPTNVFIVRSLLVRDEKPAALTLADARGSGPVPAHQRTAVIHGPRRMYYLLRMSAGFRSRRARMPRPGRMTQRPWTILEIRDVDERVVGQ